MIWFNIEDAMNESCDRMQENPQTKLEVGGRKDLYLLALRPLGLDDYMLNHFKRC